MRRRWLLGLVVAGLAGCVGLGACVGGLWMETPRDPLSVDDAPVVQVVRLPDGPAVRAAVRLPYTLEEVWQAITDYDHYGEICSFLHAAQVQRSPDGCSAEGRVETGVGGTMPYTMRMREEQGLHEYTARWEGTDQGAVHRGGWTIRSVGASETVLALYVEIEQPGVPTFLLRNLSRQRLPAVLRAVQRRLETGAQGRAW